MKNQLKITALIVVLLFSGHTVINAQYGRNVNQRNANLRNAGRTPLEFCLDIPGLDDQQKERILAVNETHRKKMDEFRLQRQTAETFDGMNKVGADMIQEQDSHIKKIKALLTAEQNEYLDNTYFSDRPRAPRNAPAYGGRGGGRGFRNAPAYGGRGGGRGFRNAPAYGGRGGGRGFRNAPAYGRGYGRGYFVPAADVAETTPVVKK